ncbi:hypothetical protein TRFO_25751 [Tritrichomonas foetus]|uniref:Uncharacterized protein n=1 Tax=Tritrichomonas foetus TaxID=1144522 RepID=A0A1J4K9Z1_9EUKA|nr:hypothetical protein TRFO_25751 [Tritrichomonas foetus]|eukprot:OHT06261.1 hypothetical protein TRFO_25751 [Tritrichomonas foetus]
MLLFFVGLFKTIQSLTFYNPAENSLNIIQNRGFLPDMQNSYARWPNKAMDIKNDAYKTGMKCSATVKIIFYTNSSHLYINYTKSKIYTYQHLSHWATSGFALYGADEDGSLHLCMPEIEPNTFTTFSALLNYYLLPEKITEYHLILLSFDEVNQLNIGVADGSYFEYAKSLNERPVVLYGTSIMHGACPCHAGNTWPNMLHRSLDFPIFNMGVT